MFSILLWTMLVGLAIQFINRLLCAKGVTLFPGCLPLIGHGLTLIRIKNNILQFFKDLGTHSIENGGISAIQLGLKTVYIITNPEEATTILTNCLEKMFVYKYIEPLFGNTLVSAEGIVWKRNRRILDLAFKQQILDSYLKVFNDQASNFINMLDQKVGVGYVDVTGDVARNVLDTACETTMGMRTGGKTFIENKYIKAVERVFEIVTMRIQRSWLIVDAIFNWSSLKKELDECLEVIHETSREMVHIQKSKYLERSKNTKEKNEHDEIRSFLQIIIENTTTSEDSVFTDYELRCFVDNVLLAAFDTSTYELLFTMICIGSDAAVQDRIHQEILEVLGKETTVTREHLAKLTYLEAAIKEALRLYPIAPLVARESTVDVQLGNVTLPAGSSIAVHLWAINRHKAYWGSNAEEYDPGRWLRPETLPEHPNAFASFSFGRRNCIGKLYAMMYMKTTLAAIIRKYRITSDHKKMEFDCYIMLKAKYGHLMKIELR